MKLFTTLRFLLPLFMLVAGTGAGAHGLNDKPCPDATISYTGSPYCSNAGTATVTLTGTSGGVYSAPAGLSIDANSGDVDLAASTAGTYTVTYTIAADQGCAEFTTTTAITITAAPTASFSYDGSPFYSCQSNAVVNFTGTTGGFYTAQPDGLSIDINTGEINIASSLAGTYTVTYTIGASGGCGVSNFTTSVTINETPATSITYPNAGYCANSGTIDVILKGFTGGTFWASSGNLSIDTNTGAINLGASTPGMYTVYYTGGTGGCAVTVHTDIEVYDPPSANFYYPNSPYCANGRTATVNFTGTTGGVFSSDPGLAIDPSSGNIDLVSSTAGTYTVTYTIAASGGCGEYTTTADITINAMPYATISYDLSLYCTNSGVANVNLVGDLGGSFSSTGLSIDANRGIINCSASSPGTYTVYYTVSNDCGSYTASTTVIIEGAPTASISYDSSPYCSNGGTAYVTFSGTSGGTYSSTAGLSIDPSTGQIDLGASTPGMYTVNYDVTTGNCSANASTGITITAAPDASIAYTSSPYCSNEGVAYVYLTGTTGGTFSAPSGLAINSTSGEIDLSASVAGTYTVTYFVAAGSGCGDFQTTTDITITTALTADFYYTNSPACANDDTAMVSFTGSTGGTFSSGSGLSIDPATGTVNITASTPGSYTVTYMLPGLGGCGDLYAYAGITIEAAANATINYPGSPYCTGGGNAGVNISGTGGGTYSSGGGLVLNQNTGDVDLGASNPGIYTVTYTVSNTCGTFQTSTDITINPSPSATISYDGSPYCANAGTAGVTLTGTGGGTYTAAGGLSINSATGDINLAASTPGSYTVNYSFSQNGCSGSTSADITIVPGPSAAIAYDGSPYCSNLGTATVTLTGDTGGTYSAGAGLSINSSTGDIDLGASTPGTYTVTYTIDPVSPCGQFTTTTSITITTGIWTGASNSDWNNAANWCGTVPTNNSDIIIPGGLANYPLVDGNYTIHNITIANEALISLNSTGILTITGSYNNSGTISNDGRIVLNGSAAQSFPGASAIVNAMKDLEVNNSSGVVFDNKFTISGTLFPTNGAITLTDTITLHSDINGTARVGEVGSGASFLYNGNGAFTVERYIPLPNAGSGRRYRLLTPSVNTVSSINANWQEGQSNTTIGTNIDDKPGYGVQITGAGANANGFDRTQSNESSLYTGTNASSANLGYNRVTNTLTNTLDAKTGYYLFIRGDRSMAMNLPNTTGMPTSATTLRATGTLLTGDISSFTNAFTAGVGVLNMVTNPYASPISWTSIAADGLTTNVAPFYTLWDAELGDRGGFVTVTADGIKSDPGSAATTDILPGQAFYIQGIDPLVPPALTIRESHKTAITGNGGIYIRQLVPPTTFSTSLFYTDVHGYHQRADGVTAEYADKFSASVDQNDAIEINNWDENIAIAREGKHLAIESRPEIITGDTLPLFMNHMKQRDYEFQFAGNNFSDPSLQATLIDNFTGKRTPVSVSGTTVVPFTITSVAGSFAANRFMVVFGALAQPVPDQLTVKAYQKKLPAGQAIQVDWTTKTETNMDRFEVERSADGIQFSRSAITTAMGNSSQPINYSWVDMDPFTGNNFYRIKSIDKAGSIKYSELVNVNIAKGASAIVVYPNPVNGNSFNLQLGNLAKGNYLIRVIDNLGRQVYSMQLQHNGGSATQAIAPKNKLTAGVYQVMVTGEGVKMTKTIVKMDQ